MKNIYTYVAKDGYAARVQDTKSYDSVRSINYPVLLPCRLMYRSQQGHIIKMDLSSCP